MDLWQILVLGVTRLALADGLFWRLRQCRLSQSKIAQQVPLYVFFVLFVVK